MTAVCTQVDDLDGKAHGAKIETILNAPFLQAAFLPWRGSNEFRRDLLRYNNMVAMLLITRDSTSGTVRAIHTDRMHYMSITLSTNLTVMHFCKLC